MNNAGTVRNVFWLGFRLGLGLGSGGAFLIFSLGVGLARERNAGRSGGGVYLPPPKRFWNALRA